MEILRLPNNQDLYEKHKAQARERTRRYRAKIRQNKLQQSVRIPQQRLPAHPQTLLDNFPFFQFAEVKLEQLSDDGDAKS